VRDLLRRHLGILHLQGVHQGELEFGRAGLAEVHDQQEELVDALVDQVLGRLEALGLDLELLRLGDERVEPRLDLCPVGVARAGEQLCQGGADDVRPFEYVGHRGHVLLIVGGFPAADGASSGEHDDHDDDDDGGQNQEESEEGFRQTLLLPPIPLSRG